MKCPKIAMLFLFSSAILVAMDNDNDKEKLSNSPPTRTPPMPARKSKSNPALLTRNKSINLLEDDDSQSLKQSLVSLKWEEFGLKKEQMGLKKLLVDFAKEQAQQGATVNLDLIGDDISFSYIPPKKN
jgi:hypothetical protein